MLEAVLSSLLSRAVTLAAPLFLMGPLFDHLGPTLFGVWLTATSLAAMVTFLDLGVGNAALTRLSAAFACGDQLAIRRVLGASYIILGSIFIFASVLVASATVLFVGSVDSGTKQSEAIIVAIVLISLFASFPSLLFVKVLQAQHEFIQSQVAQALGPIVGLLVALGLIFSDFSPSVVIFAYAFSNSVVLAVWASAYFAMRPFQRPTFSAVDRSDYRALMSLGGAFFVVLVLYVIGMNADNVVLALKADSEAVAEYGVPAKLGSLLTVITGTIYLPLWSIFGEALSRDDRRWIRRTVTVLSLSGAVAILVAGLMLAVFVDPIIVAWMGRSFENQSAIVLGWTVTAAVIAFTAPYNMVLNAAGDARQQIFPWAVFVALSVGLKILLIEAETAWSTPWITAICYGTAITPAMMVLARRRYRQTL